MYCVHETREVHTSQLIMMSLLGIIPWVGSLSLVLAGMQDVAGKSFSLKVDAQVSV